MNNLSDEFVGFCIVAVPLFFAIVLHEIAHGYVALLCGDSTAKNANRLSLNPLRHIDIFGTLILPALLVLTKAPFMFGWAKPVPVDFSGLNRPKRDMTLVALAGPMTNLVLALAAAGILAYFYKNSFAMTDSLAVTFFQNTLLCNLSLMLFNLIPCLPLDGGRILAGILPDGLSKAYARTERYGVFILVLFFVLLPMTGEKFGYDWDFVHLYMVKGIGIVLEGLDTLFGLS